MTYLYLPGSLYCEAFQRVFNEAAYRLRSEEVKLIKVNCKTNMSFCRSRKPGYLPWIECYMPIKTKAEQFKSFEDRMRQQLLKSDKANYIVCPFKSDISYEGIVSFLEKMELFTNKHDPYLNTKKELRKLFTLD